MHRYLLLPLLLFTCLGQAPDPGYQVTFKTLTAFGTPVAAHVTVLADPLHRRDLAAKCSGLRCSGIPEGAYTYSVLIEETNRKVDGSAVIYRTNQVVSIDVGTPAGEPDDSLFPKITGKVTNAQDPSKVWIRFQPLYSDTSVSTGVESNGHFQLDQLRPGNWMMLVLVDGKLVHFEPFTCKEKDNPPITVNLVATKPVIKVKSVPGAAQKFTTL